MESAFGDAGKCPRRGSQLLKKSPLHSSCPYRGVRGWRSRRSGLRPQMSKVVGVWRRAWLTARLRVQKETAALRGGRFILSLLLWFVIRAPWQVLLWRCCVFLCRSACSFYFLL